MCKFAFRRMLERVSARFSATCRLATKRRPAATSHHGDLLGASVGSSSHLFRRAADCRGAPLDRARPDLPLPDDNPIDRRQVELVAWVDVESLVPGIQIADFVQSGL
jgi:hypothetical protein